MIPKKYQYCQCDAQCSYYNDCCEDVKFTSDQTSSYEMECILLSTHHREYYGYFGVTKCPKGFAGNDIINKCESNTVLKFGPWVYNNDGIIFKNKYCAECHGEYLVNKFSLKLSGFQETDFQDPNWLGNQTTFTILREVLQSGYRLNEIEFVPPDDVRCMVFGAAEPQCTKQRINPLFGKQKVKDPNNSNDTTIVTLMIRNRLCESNATRFICVGSNMYLIYDDMLVYMLFPISVIFNFHKDYRDALRAGNCQNQVQFLYGINFPV